MVEDVRRAIDLPIKLRSMRDMRQESSMLIRPYLTVEQDIWWVNIQNIRRREQKLFMMFHIIRNYIKTGISFLRVAIDPSDEELKLATVQWLEETMASGRSKEAIGCLVIYGGINMILHQKGICKGNNCYINRMTSFLTLCSDYCIPKILSLLEME